jgi:hypothetical protein
MISIVWDDEVRVAMRTNVFVELFLRSPLHFVHPSNRFFVIL